MLLESLNEQQRQAVCLRSTNPIAVYAGPGTGKTRVILARTASLLQDADEDGSILVLTYTRAAADEILERLEHMVRYWRACWRNTQKCYACRALVCRQQCAREVFGYYMQRYKYISHNYILLCGTHDVGPCARGLVVGSDVYAVISLRGRPSSNLDGLPHCQGLAMSAAQQLPRQHQNLATMWLHSPAGAQELQRRLPRYYPMCNIDWLVDLFIDRLTDI